MYVTLSKKVYRAYGIPILLYFPVVAFKGGVYVSVFAVHIAPDFSHLVTYRGYRLRESVHLVN